MARTEVAYTGDTKVIEVAVHGCEFVGVLHRKSEGGCDAYLRMWDSELDGLDIQRITELRKRGDQNKEIYIASLPGSILNPLTRWRARSELRTWLQHSMGLEYRFRDRLKELGWKLADLAANTWWWHGR
jgi:hypothetical protein